MPSNWTLLFFSKQRRRRNVLWIKGKSHWFLIQVPCWCSCVAPRVTETLIKSISKYLGANTILNPLVKFKTIWTSLKFIWINQKSSYSFGLGPFSIPPSRPTRPAPLFSLSLLLSAGAHTSAAPGAPLFQQRRTTRARHGRAVVSRDQVPLRTAATPIKRA
jgi:hypothetical protein